MNDNLLTDAVIAVRGAGPDGERRLSLPGVLAALGRDEVAEFPALRPHQRHPWHAFLCQVAVLALERAGEAEPPRDEAAWRELLRGLTPGFPDDEPWRLVVADLAKPAFLQPPVPEGSLAGFKVKKEVDYASPGNLDVLVTAKEHGEKDANPAGDDAEQWLLGLLMLQTFSGYYGKGNQGVVRQNGGHAARQGVSLEVSLRPGPNWLRDCRIILGGLDEIRGKHAYSEHDGMGLLWLPSWRGGKGEALPLQKLHPMFVEVCRRVRLIHSGEGEVVYRCTGSEAQRVAAKQYCGVLGDPWLPLNRSKKGGSSFNQKPTYGVAWHVLFDDEQYEASLLQRFHGGDPDTGVRAVFRVFARTEGGSDGYHERVVPIEKKHVGFFTLHRDRAAETAKEMVGYVKIAGDALVLALLQLVQAAARKEPSRKQKETYAWARHKFEESFESRVDNEFFPYLWRCLDARGEAPMAEEHFAFWGRFLARTALTVLQDAAKSLPTQSALRYRARARAENKLRGAIRKLLAQRSGNA
ncbi:MAG: hypothetical protein AB7D57_13175 [Desulfovibrionaceae bacterium]